MLKKIRFLIRRHPFLYRFRFLLITNFPGKDYFDSEFSCNNCERCKLPVEFGAIIEKMDMSKNSTFENAVKIAFELSNGHKRGYGMGIQSKIALKMIYESRAGVCSDYSQVFIGLCIAAGIKVREWGISEDFVMYSPLAGHTFNEIYSTEYNKWIFIDPSRSIFATDIPTGVPLGICEIIESVSSKNCKQIKFNVIDDDYKTASRFSNEDMYLRKGMICYLLSNNCIIKQDEVIKKTRIFPLPLQHIITLIARKYYKYNVYINSNNAEIIHHRFNLMKKSLTSFSNIKCSCILCKEFKLLGEGIDGIKSEKYGRCAH